jgi:hypothetical protein
MVNMQAAQPRTLPSPPPRDRLRAF